MIPAPRRSRLPSILAALALLLLLAGCGGQTFAGTVYDPARPAPELAGLNPDGSPFSLSELDGKVALLFFGYTSCPDICPTALSQMKAVKTEIEKKSPTLADDLAVVFVTVDPERDTPERLGQYVAAFDPTFHAVFVPREQQDAVKQAYGVFAEKSSEGESAAGYLVDHTGWTYVIDRKGNLRLAFATDLPTADRVADVESLLRRS